MSKCRDTVRVYIEDYDETITACRGDVLGPLLSSRGYLPLPCGGRGLCGLCKVRVEGEVSPPSGNEEIRGLSGDERLACQTRVLGDIRVKILLKPVTLPRVSMYSINIEVKEPDPMFKPLSIERVYEFPATVFLPSGIAKHFILFHSGEVYGTAGDPKKVLLVDLGTTKIAYQLISLSGELLWEGVVANPLNAYGSDIITRIERVIENPSSLYEMRSKIVEEIGRVLDEGNAGIGFIAGNSVMEYLLLGLPVKTLAEKPFQPIFKGPFKTFIHDRPVILAPLIAGYVGGDAYSELLASLKLGIEKPYVIIDLGTNTEVVLVTDNGVYVTSTPAGPAFEGYLSRGSAIYYGGITRVRITGFSGEKPIFSIEYIGQPRGLLGTGVISLVAELYRNGLVDESGKFIRGYELVNGLKAFVISRENSVYFTQKDMREFQKAYAAVKSALLMLLKRAGIDMHDITRVLVAGSFGSNIDARDLIDLGMIPINDPGKIVYGGNMVLTGLKVMVFEKKYYEVYRELIPRIKHVNLAEEPSYTDLWIGCLNIGSPTSSK
ncbi:MAG: ASKHA domain-containing protein [Thermoprotei archaeon]